MSSPRSTWYYVVAGERAGPLALDEMRALWADGTLTAETLIWTPGLPAWLPAAELPVLHLPPEQDEQAPETAPAPPPPVLSAPRPSYAWRRFFARSIDISLPILVVYALAGVNQEAIVNGMVSPLLNVLAVGLWVPVEALMITLLGATPGKALFGIRVATADGQRLSAGLALSRAARVWVQGLGLGIPIVILVTEAFSYSRLTRTGVTPWDDTLALRVEYERFGPMRVLAVIASMVVMIMLVGVVIEAS